MKILLNMHIVPGRGAGGVETVFLALVSSLGKLSGPEEYCVVSNSEAIDWMRPHLGANTSVVELPRPKKSVIRSVVRRLFSPLNRVISVPTVEWIFPNISSGFLEGLGGGVIHFPCQDFVVCGIPSVYSPHDLQHCHYPEFFNARTLVWREETYRKGCAYARAVVVGSQWVKDDIIRQYGVLPEKIQVIPLASPLAVVNHEPRQNLESLKSKFQLDRPFILYPSMTWPHKNHLRLIDAIELIKAPLDVVCTGYKNDYWPTIEEHLNRSTVGNRVKFLGLVTAADLKAIYSLCEFVIIPSLFESTSEPIFEAWEAGKSVACSNVTALPEQTSGASVLFDPLSASSIANAIDRLVGMKAHFEQLGIQRLKTFSWEKSAKAYRALYRTVGHQILSDEDRSLLHNDWMSNFEKRVA